MKKVVDCQNKKCQEREKELEKQLQEKEKELERMRERQRISDEKVSRMLDRAEKVEKFFSGRNQ